MAVRAAIADGNFTAAGTWGLVDSTSYLNSETGSEVLTTAYSGTRSSAFTPGAITIDGIGVKLSVRTGTTGTISVHLELDAGDVDVAGTEVTINCADLPAAVTAMADGGWVFFKFAAPVLLLAATAYQVAAKTSSATQVSLFRDGTADNISRYLRTTTTGAPAAGDDHIVTGDYTGAGTSVNVTVTMDNTATTDFGAASTSLVTPSLAICTKGTLTFGTTASTNYYLKQSGNVIVYLGGTLNIGTTGTPMPSTSSAVLEFDCGAVVEFGLVVRNGTCTLQGLTKTHMLYLAADAAANATTFTLSAIPTNWLDNDDLALASTTRTVAESEKVTVNGLVTTTALTVDGGAGAGGGAQFAHLGGGATNGSEVKAEVINITRNVKIRSASSTNYTFVTIVGTVPVCDWDYAEFQYCGSATASKRGVEVQATGGTFNANGCVGKDSVSQTGSISFYFNTGSGLNYSCANCCLWNLGGSALVTVATSATGYSMTDLVAIKNVTSTLINPGDVGGTIQNITAVSGVTYGIVFSDATIAPWGTVSGFVSHSNGTGGVGINPGYLGSLINVTSYRNGSYGFTCVGLLLNVILDTFTFFGNGDADIHVANYVFNCYFRNGACDAGLVLTGPHGLRFGNNIADLAFENVTFGLNQAHTTASMIVTQAYRITARLGNCYFGSTTELSAGSQALLITGSYIGSQKHDQTAGLYKTWFRTGTITIDTTIHDGSPSARLAPNNASEKLEMKVGEAEVANGNTATISVKTRRSVSGDGTAHNGNHTQLVLLKNVAAGIAADVVLDTGTSAEDGAWETLTGTTAAVTDDAVLEFVIRTDGTAGWINADNASITANGTGDNGTMRYWQNGLPYPDLYVAGGGAGDALLLVSD